MNTKLIIAGIVVFILIVAGGYYFFIFKSGSSQPKANSLAFFEKNFVFNSLTFKSKVVVVDKTIIIVIDKNGNEYKLPLMTDLKLYKDVNTGSKIETQQVSLSELTSVKGKSVTLVLNKDDAGTYRISIIHFLQ